MEKETFFIEEKLVCQLQVVFMVLLFCPGPCIFPPNINPISLEFWISANCVRNSNYVTKIQFSIWKLLEFRTTNSSFYKNFWIMTRGTFIFYNCVPISQWVNFQILVQLTLICNVWSREVWILTKPSNFPISKTWDFGQTGSKFRTTEVRDSGTTHV